MDPRRGAISATAVLLAGLSCASRVIHEDMGGSGSGSADAETTVDDDEQAGCVDGTREGFVDATRWPDIAACAGVWSGHVHNASSLCAASWHVCSPATRPADLAITLRVDFATATSFPGCFAYDSAHDIDSCRACTGLVDQDDLAGMGGNCNYVDASAVASCTATGRVDAQCCYGEAHCAYDPTLVQGAVCCRE